MSTYVVARDDFRNALRSHLVLGVVGAFTAVVGLVFVAETGVYDDPYRTLWDVAQAVILIGPLLLAPLTYRCIVGDRLSGRLKYVLGLSTGRRHYFVGKVLSRSGVAAAAAVLGVVVGFVISAVAFTTAPSTARFAAFAGATLLFALAFVSVYVAISASVTSRSKAMFLSFAAYFVLVPFWIGMLPPIGLETFLTVAADLLNVTLSETTRHTIQSLSPYAAYGGALEPAFANAADQYDRLQSVGGDELYHQLWFNVLLLVIWSVGPLALGYLRFRRSELG